MAVRSSLQIRSNKNKKISGWFVSLVLGASLLLTFKNIQTALESYSDRQLISSPSETFASSKYEPIRLGSIADIARQDFSQIDRLAKHLNYSGTSVTELANLLAQNTQTEAEKARIIYAWIAQHITYDVAAFLDAVNNDNYPDVTATKVLRDRTTICSGFSNLYYALAKAMNLESAIVIGYAKGATPEDKDRDVNHAWNSVKINGAWYLLDATWGAGSVRDNQFITEYKPYYFATAPEEFIDNHYPEDRGWQLLERTYTRTEFNNLPNISSRFYTLGLELVSHKNYQISTSDRLDIELKIPQNIVAIAELKYHEQTITDNSTLVNRKGDRLVVSVAPPETGTYDLTIYAKEKEDLGDYGEVVNYQIEAIDSTAKLPQTFGHFHQYQASLIEPLTADLKPNWSSYFNLVVPEAEDVQVVNTVTKQWTPLVGYGSYFAGHVDIQPGNTVVVAKFPGNEQYWQLVEYQAR